MEKIVPMETFTSMLLEPSSGSNSRTYLPAGRSGGVGTGSSSSSDARMQVRPAGCTASRMVSLAKTSRFCCSSPWMLVVPRSPRMSLSPARRTLREMILAARQTSYSRFDSSPVASGNCRSCSMMNRSMVTTEVDSCTVAVGGEGNGPQLVGPQCRHMVLQESGQHLRRRVPVRIVRPDADHRFIGPQFLQPG